MTPKGHRVIRGCRDLLYVPKVYGDFLSVRPQRWQGHKRSPWPSLWPKGHRDPVVGFTLFMIPKGHRVIRGHRDLLYDPAGHGDLWPWSWPKGQEYLENYWTGFKDLCSYGFSYHGFKIIVSSNTENYSWLKFSSLGEILISMHI